MACGFHAGDPLTLRRTLDLCVRHDVRVGAQVSYRDLAGFGRRFLDVAPDDLTADVLYQLGALDGLARAAGTQVAYLKPHGALYHAMSTHHGQAEAVLDALLSFDRPLAVLGAAGSRLLQLADAVWLPTVAEGFCDRAYTRDGALVARTEPGAVLSEPDAVVAQALQIATTSTVVAADGSTVAVGSGSLCVHGDSPGAPASAAAVRAALVGAGIAVRAFV